MRVLRSSMYSDPNSTPATVVLLERDLKVPIEEAKASEPSYHGLFVVDDIFEMEDGEITEATLKAMERITEQEKHQAMLFYYDAHSLERVSERGVLTATKPAPLSVEEISYVFEQLARHPNYQHQLVLAIASDYQLVSMRDGEIKVGSA